MGSVYASASGAAACAAACGRLLRHWPVPCERLTLTTGQGETFVVACGPVAAPPVLALHGSGATAAMWMGDAAVWSRHLRVYAVDLIGEPGRSAPVRPPLGSPTHARWLDDVLDARYAIGAALPVATPLERAFMDHALLVHRHFRPRGEPLPRFSAEVLRGLGPLLAVLGGRDRMLDAGATRRRLEREAPGAEVLFLPEAGHLVLGQTGAILAFLRRHAGPGPGETSAG